ncbi:MAG TPA: DUF2076 domain-containing protein [Acetobacteraceae bacterium]|nr:DUF2076 domain-containing protein [Acetobacteraceae bacterium]
MTNEERDIITQFIARVGGAPQPQGAFPGGSVPATAQPALPPVDREADSLIGEQFQRYPEARYRITQLAFVQEHALAEAQNRIQRLEWELQQAHQAAQQAPQQGGGFFSSLFGGGRQAPPPPRQGAPAWNQGGAQPGYPPPGYGQAPPPQYAPNYQPGMFQRSGSGFLGSALTTAAGVAGGMVAGNALMNLFSGGHQGYGSGFAGGMPAASPWATPAAPVEDQGTWDNAGAAPVNQDVVDNGTWDQSGGDPGGGFAPDTSGTDDGSWDSGGGGGASDDDTF